MSMILDGSNGVTFNDSSLQGAAASPYVLKNRIINGDMRIDQRNAGASSTVINNLTVDRWTYGASQSSKFTWQQNAGSVTPPSGYTNYLGFTSSSAYTPLSSDYFYLVQKIEGYNVADLDFGLSTAKIFTFSFWVRSSLTGTFGGALENNAQNRCYPFTYTILAANTWEQKTITVTGDTSGTWDKTLNIGLEVRFNLGAGSTFIGTAGAWSAGNYISATGATNVVATNGATFYITGVQLEVGSTATPFERRMYGQELALCQRYYQTSSIGIPTNYNGGHAGIVCSNLYEAYDGTAFKITMRASPTVVLYDGVGASGKVTQLGVGNGITCAAQSISASGFLCSQKSSGNFTQTTSSYPILAGFTAESEL